MSKEHDEQYNYAKLLKRPEWYEKRAMIIAKSPRCEKCKRTGRRFAVHHRWYEYARLPWDYPDDAYMVVCNGRCHREADEDREDQERDEKNYRRHGWQWELGKKCQKPGRKVLQSLAEHQPEFKAWLIQNGILQEPWSWDVYPLWHLWNELSREFLDERVKNSVQLPLNL